MPISFLPKLITKFIGLILRPTTIALLVTAFVGGLYVVERQLQHMPYILLVLVCIGSVCFIISKRFAFSVYASMTAVGLITLMSIAKFRGQGFDLHVYDLAFTGSDVEALKFLLTTYSNLALPVIAVTILSMLGLVMIWRAEQPSAQGLGSRVAPLVVSAALIPLAYPTNPDTPRYFHYLAGFNASSFFVSFTDLANVFAEDPITANIGDATAVAPFETSFVCDGLETKPDIYIVLSESSTNFNIYPQVNLENISGDAFNSDDRSWRSLRVETFGGGTWVSNFALMTGLSTRDFAWRAPYLTVQLKGQIKESLATLLKSCGYQTAVLTPMKHSFVNEGPFLESIGFDTVLDFDAIDATSFHHRDDFYYYAADDFLKKQMQTDDRPVFMQIQTMFGHSPFDERLEPQIQIQDADFVEDKPLNEHIRRVLIAQNDFHAFIERRKKMQPARPFVVLEFGDHQALVTRPLADELHGGNSLADVDSIAYKTHYTLHAYNVDMDLKYFNFRQLDIGFLGASFMQAIGVPLSPMYQDLADLRDKCDGRYADCHNRSAVDHHLKRRIASGLLSLPNT